MPEHRHRYRSMCPKRPTKYRCHPGHWPKPVPRYSPGQAESANCRDADRVRLAMTLQWKPRERMTQRRRSRLAMWRTTYCRPQGHWPKLAARYPTGHAGAPTYRRGTTPFWWMAAVRRQRPRQCTTWRCWPMYAKWPVKHHRRRGRPSQPTPRWAIGSLAALTQCRGTIPPWHAAVRRPKPRTRTTRGQLRWPMQTSFRDVDTYATPCHFFHHSDLASDANESQSSNRLAKVTHPRRRIWKSSRPTDPQATHRAAATSMDCKAFRTNPAM